jgi:hypothetical protein
MFGYDFIRHLSYESTLHNVLRTLCNTWVTSKPLINSAGVCEWFLKYGKHSNSFEIDILSGRGLWSTSYRTGDDLSLYSINAWHKSRFENGLDLVCGQFLIRAETFAVNGNKQLALARGDNWCCRWYQCKDFMLGGQRDGNVLLG